VFRVATDAQIALHMSENVQKQGKLSNLPTGTQVRLKLATASKEVVDLQAEGPTMAGVLKETNAAKGTITVAVKGQPDKTFAVDKGVRIVIDNGKAGKLAGLPKDALVALKLSVDQKVVVAVHAEGPTVFGFLKGQAVNDAITVGGKLGDQVVV